jgi:hypothetical protein
MSDISDKIKNLAQELTKIEVNTIIKANMTGRKMPDPRHALIEIAKRYRMKLIQLGHPIQEDDGVKMGCYESFDRIREKASDGIERLRKNAGVKKMTDQEERDMVMLARIQTMSDQIKGVFNSIKRRKVDAWDNIFSHDEIEEHAPPPLPLETTELITIRRIWEVGLEEIAMQTVIHLDGDVVTRIQPQYATESQSIIHQIHNQSVSMAFTVWGELISIVKSFFTILIGHKPPVE